MILLLNAAVMPSEGVYTLKKISKAEFRTCLQAASVTGDFKSYIGYPETARIIEEITGVTVEVNREQAGLMPGDVMLIVKLRQRVSEPASKAVLAPSSEDFEFYQCQWHTLSQGETIMLKALTFLGTGDYQQTTYIKHDDPTKSCETDLFPEAVAELYEPDRLIAFATEAVRSRKAAELKRLEEKIGGKFEAIAIPNGNSEAQLWDIFQRCAEAVDRDDEIILDITHAFRSIPLLVFIVAGYLRQVKRVRLKHIIYGAFEARDTTTDQTPIFDLTPFVQLLDWTNAVNVFQNSGDARPIAGLAIPDPKIANALKKLSETLLTNRTLEAQEAAFDFNGLDLTPMKEESPPFGMLISQLQANYRQMAVYDPSSKSGQSLKKQWIQIKWYIENQHYLQAVTLMREWLISYECIHHGTKDWLNQGSRDAAEARLKGRRGSRMTTLSALVPNQIPTKLWEQCTEVRNDLAHCGMRYRPKIATTVIRDSESLFDNFGVFFKSIESTL